MNRKDERQIGGYSQRLRPYCDSLARRFEYSRADMNYKLRFFSDLEEDCGRLQIPSFGPMKQRFKVSVRPSPLELRGGAVALGYERICEVSTYFRWTLVEGPVRQLWDWCWLCQQGEDSKAAARRFG